MDNNQIASQIDLMAKLMELHGENSFKTKNYAFAVTMIKKVNEPLDNIAAIQNSGLGAAVQAKLIELVNTGHIAALEELIQQTPEGVIDILNVKGLGPKKVAVLWKEYGIDSLESLESACIENRLMTIKGFGLKTQAKIYEQIEFLKDNQGYVLWKQADDWKLQLEALFDAQFEGMLTFVGAYALQMPILNELECYTTADLQEIHDYIAESTSYEIVSFDHALLQFIGEKGILTSCYFAYENVFSNKVFEASCSIDFYNAFVAQYPLTQQFESESAIFEHFAIPFIPNYLRDDVAILDQLENIDFSSIITPADIRGAVHNHSTWSDGIDTLEAMAKQCIALGLEYLVISDHSQSAGYANGLSVERIFQQHQEIDNVNQKLAPFKIFKSIESDILSDGSLDYPQAVLDTFDLIVASVHSNLTMNKETAMNRILTAIRNPYTNILGHPTGRLLLSRKGYELDYDVLIAEAKMHDVVIEINANPRRLDLDYQYISKALAQGVLLSINPDAHSTSQLALTKYGVIAADRKSVV